MAHVRARSASLARRVAALTLLAAATTPAPASAQILPIPDPGHPSFFGQIASRAGTTLAVASGNSPIYQFDATTGALIRTLPLTASRLAPVGDDLIASRLAIGFPGLVQVFDGDTGAVLRTIADPEADVAAGFGIGIGAIGPDVLVAASGSGLVYRFDVATGAILQTYADPTPSVADFPPPQYGTSLAVVGSFLVVGDTDDAMAHVFDAASGTFLRTLTPPVASLGFGWVEAAADTVYVSDGMASNGTRADAVYRFDPATGAHLQTLVDPLPDDEFGLLPRMVGDHLFVGATQRAFNGVGRSGTIFVFGDDGRLVESLRPVGLDLPDDGPAPGVRAVLGTRVAIRTRAALNRVDLIGPCGNAILDAGEACDDGNLLDGDCCSSTCTFDFPVCEPGLSQRTTLSLKRLTPQTKDTLALKWTSAGAFGGNLGDPLDGTDYALCVIDDLGGTPTLAASSAAPATNGCPQNDACWKASSNGSLTLKAKTARPEGLTKVLLKPGVAGKGKIVAAGRGMLLGLPQRPLTAPVRVVVRRRDASVCWDGTFDAGIQLNTPELFKARAD